MKVEEAKGKECCQFESKCMVWANSAWHGDGLTQRLRMRVIAV